MCFNLLSPAGLDHPYGPLTAEFPKLKTLLLNSGTSHLDLRKENPCSVQVCACVYDVCVCTMMEAITKVRLGGADNTVSERSAQHIIFQIDSHTMIANNGDDDGKWEGISLPRERHTQLNSGVISRTLILCIA